MQIVIGISEVALAMIFIILTWKFDLVERSFRMDEKLGSFMRAHSKRIDGWFEKRGEGAYRGFLRNHPRILQWIWSIAAFAILILGIGALFGLRECMLLEVIIPIGLFLTILFLLSA